MPPEKIASLFEVAVDLALEKCLEEFGKVGGTPSCMAWHDLSET